ncbi:HNH endonuclease [Mycobacterium sp. NPDC050041]|uniref:HNH endonuclease n=1 Tax=Mycobacterium sp. NPDC050041 TaxID=3364293 RepID=UPI003C2C97CE
MFEELSAVPFGADEARLHARLAALETAKAACAAGQARVAVELDAMRRAREAAQGVPAAKRGRGLAGEIALARRASPNQGGRHLGVARALVYEMPCTLAALECGVLTEWRATLIVRESACLSVEHRKQLDAEMCGDLAALEGLGDGRIEAEAKKIAYRLDAQAVVDRAAKAVTERTVTIRPAPDVMAYVSALLPMAQGVAVYAALKNAADTTFDERSRGQVMADTLYERVTGRSAATPVPVTVDLVMSDRALLGGDGEPAHLQGYGPVPASIARQMVADAAGAGVAALRRLYARPVSGALVAMESRSRCFPKALARFIDLRDQRCRTPYCDAPIRHHDHADPHHRGGATSAVNALGDCARCNYDKEAPGWQVSTGEVDGVHTADFVAPSGGRYRSTAPPAPGKLDILVKRPHQRITCGAALLKNRLHPDPGRYRPRRT